MSPVEMNRMIAEMKIVQDKAKNNFSVDAPNNANQFGDVFAEALTKVNELQKDASSLQKSFELGQSGVDLPDVMVAMQKSKVAFTAMTQVRNKIVEAYQEIMNMPI